MRKVVANYINRPLGILTLLAIALWCTPSFAQATYTYTGPNFTYIYSGLAGWTYTTSDHITATLRLNEWLPSNASCLDLSKVSGFSLVMRDGVNPSEEAVTPDQGSAQAVVSTDASGHIIHWSIHVYLYPFQNPDTQYIVYSDDGPYCGAAGYNDFAQVEPLTIANYNFSGGSTLSTGTWTNPDTTALATMLISEFQLGALYEMGDKLVGRLQDVVDDLSHKRNDSCRDLADVAYEVGQMTAENKFATKESQFILETIAIMEEQNHCGKGSHWGSGS